MHMSGGNFHHGPMNCDCMDYGPRIEGLIIPCLLTLLREKPSHGYDLIESLTKMNFLRNMPDPGVIYRHLRRLEEEGFVESRLEPGSGGPARKVYSITAEGEGFILSCEAGVRSMKTSLEDFLSFLKAANIK